MATRARLRWSLYLVVLATTAVMAMPSGSGARAPGHAASSFPCRWNWSLYDGMRAGYVTAGNDANCAGRQGSLTLGVRLLKLDPMTNAWHTVKAQTKTFRHLNTSRFVEVATPCVPASFRAQFRWTLRDTRRVVVARHAVNTQKLLVTSTGCRFIPSGPGSPPG